MSQAAPSPPGVRRQLRRLATIAGPHRSPRRNRHLASVLALNAGVLNSAGFIAVTTYTSHMTGLTAAVADHLVTGDRRLVFIGLTAIGMFVVGAMTCAVLFNWARRRELQSRFAGVIVLEALLILVFGLLASSLEGSARDWVIIGVLGFTMGLQNAIITKISGAQIRTTHVTGMITDIGIELGKALYRSRRPGIPPVLAHRERLGLHTVLVAMFFIGGVIGAAGYLLIGFPVVLPAAALLLTLAMPPVLADLRRCRAHR